MGTLCGYLFLMTIFVVKATEDFSDMLQKEVTYFDLKNEDVIEEVLPPELPHIRGRSQTLVGPRSMVPHIPFPPARPTQRNLEAICRDGNRRPRYPKGTLPTSGFGYLYRKANSINQLESWFTECCSTGIEDKQLTLCCLQQAWEESLSAFCESEFMVKTSHYHCCKKKDQEKLHCFEKQAPDRSYLASGDKSWDNIPSPNFNFNSSTCQKPSSKVTPRTIREEGTPDISFPLGRPNSINIRSICNNRKKRPIYNLKCLPSSGYDWLARQSKATNSLEKGIHQCCKKKEDEQACVEQKWKMMVDNFCKDEKKDKAKQFDCCKKESGEEQYECFAAAAPNPDYILDVDIGSPSQEPNLDMMCGPESNNQRIVTFFDAVAPQCCRVLKENWLECFQKELEKYMCTDLDLHVRCCKKKSNRGNCFTKMLLRAFPKESISRSKKCPISF